MYRDVSLIVEFVAQEMGISVEMLRKERNPSACRARACCYFVLRTVTKLSFPELGEEFDRDHSTIMDQRHAHVKRMVKDVSACEMTDRVIRRYKRIRELELSKYDSESTACSPLVEREVSVPWGIAQQCRAPFAAERVEALAAE